MPKPVKRLSPGEWEVMEIIWRHTKSLSVREVLQVLCPNSERAYTTIQTIMNNLEKKGYLVKEKIGLVNFYTATVKRPQAVRNETRNFVSKVFSGSFHDLTHYLINSGKLAVEDIEELKKLILEKEEALERE